MAKEKKISAHISYKEATYSATATRKGITNVPDAKQLKAMQALAKNVFEPLRKHFNEPIRINSFFRSLLLNKTIGGSKTSQHCTGEAIDLDGMNGITNKQLYDYIKNSLEFDQLIWEFGTDKEPDWVHVSYTTTKTNRNELLRAQRKNGKSVYTITGTGKKTTTKPADKTKTGVVKVQTILNVREKNSTRASISGKLKNGAKVIIKGKEKDWLKIESGKLKGWVAARYVVIKK